MEEGECRFPAVPGRSVDPEREKSRYPVWERCRAVPPAAENRSAVMEKDRTERELEEVGRTGKEDGSPGSVQDGSGM